MNSNFFLVNKEIIGLCVIALMVIFLVICIIDGIIEDVKEAKRRKVKKAIAKIKASRKRIEADEKARFLEELYIERYKYENTKGNDIKLYC